MKKNILRSVIKYNFFQLGAKKKRKRIGGTKCEKEGD